MKRYIIPFVTLTLSGLIFADNHSQSLFNGKDLTGWQDRNGNASKWEVVDGNLQGKKKLGDIWSKERFADFVLSLEFKTTGNSGIFFRTDNPKNPVQTGIEVQVERPNGPNKHSVGALYDLVPPKKNNATKGWNKVKITAKDNMITVEMNGEIINGMDLNKWTEPNKNPDGVRNL